MSQDQFQMTSSKPYMIRAMHSWISDNGLTTYLTINTNHKGVVFPSGSSDPDGYTNINISNGAVRDLFIENDCIYFRASFGGVPMDIVIPMVAIESVFSPESMDGVAFPPEDIEVKSATSNKKAPALTIVK